MTKNLYIFLTLQLLFLSAFGGSEINIKSGTYVNISGNLSVQAHVNSFTNNGTYTDTTGNFNSRSACNFSGTGNTTFGSLNFNHSGNTAFNTVVNVRNLINLVSGSVNSNTGNLFIRSDMNPNANVINDGILTGSVQGIVTKASVLSGGCPSFNSLLSLNISGSVMNYQWQNSPDSMNWTNVNLATGSTYNANVTSTVYFRCLLTTSNSLFSQYSPGIKLTYNGPLLSDWYLDADNDGYYINGPVSSCTSPGPGYNTTALFNGDCDDNNASINAGASEITCNGIDENCNGMSDDGFFSMEADSISSDALNNEICIGSSATLSVNGGILGTGAVWNWYLGSCSGVFIGTGSSILVSPSVSASYFVKAEGLCNSSVCKFLDLTVSSPLASAVVVPPINNLPAFACNGTSVNNINVPTVAGATKYNWDGPAGTSFNGAGSSFTNSTPDVNIVFGATAVGASGYYIGVQAANSCGTTLRKVQWVRGVVSVPAVSGPSVVCAGSNGVYSVTNAPIIGVQSYTWSGPAGTTFNGDPSPYTSANTSVTAILPIGFTSGSICVTANAACFSTVPKCINVSTSPVSLGLLSGVFSVCPPATQTYTVSNPGVAGGTYNWTLPANASGSSASDNISVSFAPGFVSGNISVTYTNVCGVTSPVRTKTINIGTPTVPASITTTTTNGLCGQPASFQCPAQAGASFNWTFPSGSAPSGIPGGTNSVSSTMPGAPFSTGEVCVTATNSCGTSAPRCITVKGAPLTPGIITPAPASWCAPTAGIQLSGDISALSGVYNLNWVVIPASDVTYISGQGTNTYTVDWDHSGSANVILTASNACGSGSRTLSLNIAGCSRITADTVIRAYDNLFSVYPNPASTVISFHFNSDIAQPVKVSLVDFSGRSVITETVNASEGFNNGKIDISKLAKGFYTFKAASIESTSAFRILVE